MSASRTVGVDRVSVVTVLFNSAEVIESCLRTIDVEAEVVVVDNASHDDGAARARRARSDAVVIEAGDNLGFGAGCEVGWRRASRPYVAFVNPDVLLGADTLAVLLARLRDEPHGIVGPALLDADDHLRSPNREPSVAADVVNLLPTTGRWAHLLGWDGRLSPDHPTRRLGGPVAFVEGACFMVRRADLEAIGGFDPDLFLYCEEASLAMRLRRHGGRAFYEPATVVQHAGAHATDRVAPFAERHYFRSRVILYRKRDGETRGRVAALLLGIGATVALITAIANAILRRPTAVTPARPIAMLRGVVDGVRARLR